MVKNKTGKEGNKGREKGKFECLICQFLSVFTISVLLKDVFVK